MAGVMRAEPDDYCSLLLGLRPTGPAWPADDAMLRGVADGLARAHNRALVVPDEADPRTTLEMLAAWERNAGLPDACTGPAVGLAERRDRLVQQLTGRGGQSRAFFLGLAAALGHPGCSITEFAPFTVGSSCTASLHTAAAGWPHAWRLNVPSTAGLRVFTATAGCDEALRGWGSATLECVIGRVQPAHGVALFGYFAPAGVELLTVARASTGTYIDATGALQVAAAGVARSGYGVYTLTEAGGQDWAATPGPNLLAAPENFAAASWSKVAVAVAENAMMAPDGTLTADVLTSTGDGYAGQLATIATTAPHTGSLWLKVPSGSRTVTLYMVRNVPNAVVAAKTVTLTDVWQRFTITGTPLDLSRHVLQVGGGASFTAGAVIHAWGAKLEVGGTATGYQPQTPARHGLQVEAGAANAIRNPRCEGAVAGTPGTLPTFWGANALPSGLARTVVGSGIEEGIPYVDVRWQGAATGYTDLTLDSPAVTPGQTWTASAFVRLVGGSWAGVSGANLLVYGAPSYSDNAAAPLLGVTVAPLRMQRQQATRTFSDPTTTAASVRITLTADGAVDITLRIGLPQCEQGPRASSPILPPVGSPGAATRETDWPRLALTTLPGWTPAAWTVVVDHEVVVATPAVGVVPCGIGSNFARSIYLAYGSAGTISWAAGYAPTAFPVRPTTAGVHRDAIALDAAGATVCANGGVPVTLTGIAPPLDPTALALGNAPWSASNATNGFVRRARLYNRRLTPAELQAVTAGGEELSGLIAQLDF